MMHGVRRSTQEVSVSAGKHCHAVQQTGHIMAHSVVFSVHVCGQLGIRFWLSPSHLLAAS